MESEHKPTHSPRRKPWRWLLRALVVVGVLLTVLAAVVQIVLWTDWPRQILVAEVRQQLGMEIEVDELSAGWGSTTELRGVRLRLPLEDRPIFSLDRLELRHTTLLGMAMGGFELHELVVGELTIEARQRASGQWNLTEFARHIEMLGRGSAEPTGPPAMAVALPRLKVGAVNVNVELADGSMHRLPGLAIDGRHTGPLVYQAQIAGDSDATSLALGVNVQTGAGWRHTAGLKLIGGDAALPLVGPLDLDIHGEWEAGTDALGLLGRLHLTHFRYGGFRGAGVIELRTRPDGLSIHPSRLTVVGPYDPFLPATLHAGSVILAGQSVLANDLIIHSAGGTLRADGDCDLATATGRIKITWQELRPRPDMVLSGSLVGDVIESLPGQRAGRATIQLSGMLDGGALSADMLLEGVASAMDDMDWTLRCPRVLWQGELVSREIRDLQADIRVRPGIVDVPSLTFQAPEAAKAVAGYDFSKRIWWLYAHSPDFRLEPDVEPLSFHIDAYGDAETATLKKVSLRLGKGSEAITVDGDGIALLADRGRIEGRAWLNVPLAGLNAPGQADDAVAVGGLGVRGAIWPMDLSAFGTAEVRNLRLRDRVIPSVSAELEARVRPDRLSLRTLQAFEALGATITANGRIRRGAGSIEAEVRSLDLEQIAELLRRPGLRGVIDGRVALEISRDAPPALRASLSGRDFAFDVVRVDRFDAPEVVLRDGKLTTEREVTVSYGDGRGSLSASVDIGRPDIITLHPRLEQWPLRLDDTWSVVAEAEGRVDWNTATRQAAGEVRVKSRLLREEQPAGEVQATLGILDATTNRPRTIVVRGVEGEVFGGTVAGNLLLPVNDLLKADGYLSLKSLDMAQLHFLSPERLAEMRGLLSMTLRVKPADAPRAPLPMQVELALSGEGLRYGRVEVKGGQFRWFADMHRMTFDEPDDTRTPEGRARPLSERQWNVLAVAGGHLGVWAQGSMRQNEATHLQLIATAERLDLDQLARATAEWTGPVPGRVDARVLVLGDPFDARSLYATADIDLRQSDLYNVPGLHELYARLSPGGLQAEPKGEGIAEIRFERGRVALERLRLFDRGIQTLGQGRIVNVFDDGRSPLDFTVSGTARPFKEMKLPLFADLDAVTSTLQQGLVAFAVRGTLDDYRVSQLAFEAMGAEMRKILTGELRDAQ